MDEQYRQATGLSTIEPAQAIRQIPDDTIEHARRFAAACATYDDLKTRSPFLEQNPEELYRRVGERLSGAEHAVYGVVRQARRLHFPGARLSYAELAQLIGRHERTCRRAVAVLETLELLKVVPQFRDGGIATTFGYDRSQVRNTYALGRNAKEPKVLPGLGGAPPPRRSRFQTPDKTPDLTASLSEGRTEVLRTSVSPSCLPSSSTITTGPRVDESTSSTSDRPLPRPSMPASPAAEGSGGKQSKIRTGGLATLGELAAAKAAQNGRSASPAPCPAAAGVSGDLASESDLARRRALRELPPETAAAVRQVDDPELAALITRTAATVARRGAR